MERINKSVLKYAIYEPKNCSTQLHIQVLFDRRYIHILLLFLCICFYHFFSLLLKSRSSPRVKADEIGYTDLPGIGAGGCGGCEECRVLLWLLANGLHLDIKGLRFNFKWDAWLKISTLKSICQSGTPVQLQWAFLKRWVNCLAIIDKHMDEHKHTHSLSHTHTYIYTHERT